MTSDVTTVARRIIANVETVIIGKRPSIVLLLVAWLSEGHILLEDVPGVAIAVLTHRAILKPEARLRQVTAEAVVSEVVAEVAVPILKGP